MTGSTATVITEFETQARVAAVTAVAADVVEIALEAADGSPLPPWTPGAHIDLVLPGEIVRQYSLCGSPRTEDAYKVAVLKAPDSRGGSVAVHELAQGQTLTIRGPRNNFPLTSSGRYVFIAGGIGITPILPMIEEVETAGARWELHYGGRSRDSMAYLQALEKYGDAVHLVPQDEAGLLDIPTILAPQEDTLVYVCGPEPLLAVVEEACASWPSGSLRLERFVAKQVEREGADSEFEIVLQRTGITVTVGAQESVFDAMRRNDVPVLGSCLEGICGTCETGVLDGEVDHRDSVLDEDEQEAHDCMMVCVSRARSSRLVLDA